MTHSKRDVDELKTMKSRAADLREKRKQRLSTATSGGERHVKKAPKTDKAVLGLDDHLEVILKKIEEAARERPGVAMLAAFTLGLVINRLLSRK
jgi:hypothetical protein